MTEPYFPSLEDATEINKAALEGWGQTNHHLLRPDVLQGALGRAANHYHYGTGSEHERIADAAGALAHGVGGAQAFEDGNKRSAYWLTHFFAHENGLPHLVPDDDEHLADHLVGHGEGTHRLEDTQNLFRSRLGVEPKVSSWKFAQTPRPHYNPRTGLLCNCNWGAPHRRRNTRKASSVEMRKLIKQDQKIFRSPEGQEYLTALGSLVESNPEAEPLVPWLASRFKHGDITVNHARQLQAGNSPVAWHLPHWVQWMNARQHPLRRGKNIMSMDPSELNTTANALVDDVHKKQAAKNWVERNGQNGRTVHTFKKGEPLDPEEEPVPGYELPEDALIDPKHHGWTVRQLESEEDCEAESDALGHCIGQDGQPYKQNITQGNIKAYSLRDQHGYPKATWHFNPDGTLAHLQGSSGYPKSSYRDLISHFHKRHGMDDDGGDAGAEQELDDGGIHEYTAEGAHDLDTFLQDHHPEGEGFYGRALNEAYELGEGVHEDADINVGEPNWSNIVEELREAAPRNRTHVYNTALSTGQHDGLKDEIDAQHEHATNMGYADADQDEDGQVSLATLADEFHDHQVRGNAHIYGPEWNYKRAEPPAGQQFHRYHENQFPHGSWSTDVEKPEPAAAPSPIPSSPASALPTRVDPPAPQQLPYPTVPGAPHTFAHNEGWKFAQTKTADKLNDFLMNPKSRPDLQSPEAQSFLQDMKANYHNDKTDPLMPWLTREWKKGRVAPHPGTPGQYVYKGTNGIGVVAQQTLSPARLNHWADWYQGNHPTRRGVDLMQHKVHEIHGKIGEYEADMQAQARAKQLEGETPTSGKVVHQLPNGWNVQQLHSPEALTEEGDHMGHCVGSYADQVESGSTKIYSLRDKENKPHVTMEVSEDANAEPRYVYNQLPEHKFEERLNSPEGSKAIEEHVQRRKTNTALYGDDLFGRGQFDPGTERNRIIEDLKYQNRTGRPISSGSDETHLKIVPRIPNPKFVEPGPHAGEIQQIQGKGNSIPKPEYQAMLKHWMETLPEDERPQWNADHSEELTTADEVAEAAQGGDGGYGGGTYPHGDYGVKGPKPIFDWPNIIDDFHNDHSESRRGWGEVDPEDLANGIHTHLTGLPEEERVRHAQEIAKTIQHKKDRYRDEAMEHASDQAFHASHESHEFPDFDEWLGENPQVDPEDARGAYSDAYERSREEEESNLFGYYFDDQHDDRHLHDLHNHLKNRKILPSDHHLSKTSRIPRVLHHWTEPHNLEGWMDENAIRPHGVYLTPNHDVKDWNPDVPQMEHPVRLDIDTSKLDHSLFGYDEDIGEGYNGSPEASWGNYYYKGPIPREALKGHKAFKAPSGWNF